MKKFTLIVIVFLLAIPVCVSANGKVPKTNIGGITIVPPNESANDGFIRYEDSGEEPLGKDYTGLFINGSIIKNVNVINDSGDILLPLRLIAEYLGAKVDWEPAAAMVTITDGSNIVNLFIDSTNTTINDRQYIADKAPKIINSSTYVSAAFIKEILGAKVDYFDGDDTAQPHIVIRMRHVMISRYPADAKVFTEEEAVEKTREQLLIAYEKKFGKYIPPGPGEMPAYATGGDKDMLRGVISNLEVVYENDRYYVIPVVYDFWFDKYTGDIYTFYNGMGMDIRVFDPYAAGALAFPG